MVEYKNIWTDNDFDDMSFQNCRIYGICFPYDDRVLKLDLDYAFEWILPEKSSFYKFLIAPCTLIFKGTAKFRINIDMHERVGIDINNIERNIANEPYTKYNIITDNGNISFLADGYTMYVREAPVISDSQDLGR